MKIRERKDRMMTLGVRMRFRMVAYWSGSRSIKSGDVYLDYMFNID